MGGENADMWRNHMYVHCTFIVTKLLHQWHIYNNSKIVVTCNYNAIFQKIKYG